MVKRIINWIINEILKNDITLCVKRLGFLINEQKKGLIFTQNNL